MKIRMCDPPEGWKYGFPMEIPDDVGNGSSFFNWLISEGYPEKNIETRAKHCRFWYKEEEDNESSK